MSADYKQFESLEIRQDGKLLTVSLNRPESLNAVNGAMHDDLENIWSVISKDETVGAVLLRGNGRCFCAGGDMKYMADASEGGEAAGFGPVERMKILFDTAKVLVERIIELRQPLVAAVHGYAMGLGATLALSSDIVVAAEDATFSDSHVSIGLVPADGGTLLWPLLLPLNTAKYYLMTGERLSGADAERLGLVQKAVPAAELAEVATTIARNLADGPTLALGLTKSMLNRIIRERANFVLDGSLMMEAVTMASADHAEATKAFMEKRTPRYTGR